MSKNKYVEYDNDIPRCSECSAVLSVREEKNMTKSQLGMCNKCQVNYHMKKESGAWN